MKTRIFITGIYRSGTTLISRILNNHSKLWVTYDSVHFMRFSYNRFNPINNKKNAQALVEEIHNRILRRWNMKFNMDKVLSNVFSFGEVTYPVLYDQIMISLAVQEKRGIVGWGEKTNVCWGQIPNFIGMFPEGKVIHVLRDPRDVMCSYREMTYEPGYAYLDSAFASLHSFESANKLSMSLDRENYCFLKYEDIINAPEQTVRNLCDFLGIRFEKKMIDVKSFTSREGKRWTGDSSFNRGFRKISRKPMERWKKNASAAEIFLVEMINRPVMRDFGYDLSGVQPSRKEWIKLYDILSEPILDSRYKKWLKNCEGVEAYPSDPRKAG